MEELSLDNILNEADIANLFTEEEEIQEDSIIESIENNENNDETAEILDVDNLFTEESESVGSGDNKEVQEDTPSDKGVASSNFYSSIAKALKEEGVFPDLNEEDLKNIKAPEDFVASVEKQISARLEERQKKIDEALSYGVEVTEIKRYENTLNYLDTITDTVLKDESEKGDSLRKQLIMQDFINRGYSEERARREITKSFNAGTDIEDAKEALISNREFFNSSYSSLIEEAKKEEIKYNEERAKKTELLKKSILEDKELLGDLQIDKSTRQKIYDNISKPIYKDNDTGVYYTTIQKYEKENSADFIKNLGIIFTLTNGFKNLDGLVKNKVRKEVNKGFKELEHTINNTMRTSDGTLKFASGVSDAPDSFLNKGWVIGDK